MLTFFKKIFYPASSVCDEALDLAVNRLTERMEKSEPDQSPIFVAFFRASILVAIGIIPSIATFNGDVVQTKPFDVSKMKEPNKQILRIIRAIFWHYFNVAWKSNDGFGMNEEEKKTLQDGLRILFEYDEKDLEYGKLMEYTIQGKREFYYLRLLEWMLDGKCDDAMEWSIVLSSYLDTYTDIFFEVFQKILIQESKKLRVLRSS